MESLSTSSLTVSNASATGSGKSKVALKPGHSLMDWIRYTHSGIDLTSTGGKVLEISARELAHHNTKKDAWIALKGKVYNITPYLDFHPGGEEELMRGAGKDATDLFNQVHQWVNAESMLQKCFVGILKKSWSLDAPKFPSMKSIKKPKNPKIIPSVVSSGKEKENLLNKVSEWSLISGETGEISIRSKSEGHKILLKVSSTKMKYNEIFINLEDGNVYIKFNKDSKKWVNIEFPSIVQNNQEIHVAKSNTEDDTVEFSFDDGTEGLFCNASKTNLMWSLSDRSEYIFWPCKLKEKIAVNYNTYLFTFVLPPNVKMWVPVGCHVSLKSEIEGVEIIRCYTPVLPSLDISELNFAFNGSYIVLMIKIYPSGTFTPLLNLYDIGESILISSYVGTFSETILRRSSSIVMLAAGTGITPMIRVIYWVLSAQDKKRSLLLLFFNKKEEDILWRTEFENCSKCCENFQVIHILSQSDKHWSGYTGTICEDIIKELLPPKHDNQLMLICGPLPFTSSAERILNKSGYRQDSIFAFTS